MQRNNNECTEEKKLTFTKFNVLWADLMIISVPVISVIMKEYPPNYICYIWCGYWMLRLILTAVLHVKKKGRKQKYTFFDAVVPYLNEDNANALAEKYLGITPKCTKTNSETKTTTTKTVTKKTNKEK